MSKEITAYCIKEPNGRFKGQLNISTIGYTRKVCIHDFCHDSSGIKIWDWEYLNKTIGWTCVKIKITEL